MTLKISSLNTKLSRNFISFLILVYDLVASVKGDKL